MRRLLLALAALVAIGSSQALAQGAQLSPSGCKTVTETTSGPTYETFDANGQHCVKDVDVLAAIQAPPALGAASGGWTPIKLAGLTNTAVAIKAAAGQVGKVQCYNPNASEVFVQLYNVAAGSVTVGTTASLDIVLLAPTATGGFTLSVQGEQFGTAISAAATTTAGGGTAPGSPVDCSIAYN